MSSTDIACVAQIPCSLGESTLWSPTEQALYWTDIVGGWIHRLDGSSHQVSSWTTSAAPGSLGLTGDSGKLLVGMQDGFSIFDTAAESETVIATCEADRPNVRLNDGKMDRAGRFWCGSMSDPDREPVGILYRLTADGKCDPMRDGITVPNAICWSPDSRVMYFADTPTQKILAFDYDIASGEIENERIFVDVPEERGRPDGATVDAEGFLWSACIFGGRLARYDPDGKLEREIELPVAQPTCCAFGGPDLDTLYISTATIRMTDAQRSADPMAGCLFACQPGVKGIAETVFGG